MPIREDWDALARKYGYPNCKALIVHQYILLGRGTGYLAKMLGCNRHTPLNMLKACGIQPRGASSHFMTASERDKWELVLKMEGYNPEGIYNDRIAAPDGPGQSTAYPEYKGKVFRYKQLMRKDGSAGGAEPSQE